MDTPTANLGVSTLSIHRVAATLEKLISRVEDSGSPSQLTEELSRRLYIQHAQGDNIVPKEDDEGSHPTVVNYYLCEARHDALIGAPNSSHSTSEGLVSKWRQKERLKTTAVALVVCLNIGVDPPDVVRVSPCARTECWIDPLSMPAAKALDAIGKSLQVQYERWQPRAKYKMHLDPTTEDVKRLAVGCRKNARSERVLFHYNGHGVPRPTANGEIWVFNRSYTQYIPLSLFDLQSWVGTPAIYVFDCSNAGQILASFRQYMMRQQQHQAAVAALENGKPPPHVEDPMRSSILLCACGVDDVLPQSADLPADLFTACLTTPIKVSLKWFWSRAAPRWRDALPDDELRNSLADRVPGQQTDRKTPLGELNWIFTAITDTIAWNVLPRALFQRLFRQDLLVASLFRNFLLADRVLRAHGCTPVSHPRLPATHQHPMWQAWDMASEMCLLQLPAILTSGSTVEYVPSPFFAEQLTAFELWLEHGGKDRPPPEQLPVVLQVLLSQVHRLRALVLLGRFLDMGSWAVDFALSVGIFPYVLKLLQTTAVDLRATLVFIWAKILAWDANRQVQSDLTKDGGFQYFVKQLDASQSAANTIASADSRAQAAFVLASICRGHPSNQRLLAKEGLPGIILAQLPAALAALGWAGPEAPGGRRSRVLLVNWLALALGRAVEGQPALCRAALREQAHEALVSLVRCGEPEVRAAACFALGSLILTDPADEDDPVTQEGTTGGGHNSNAARPTTREDNNSTAPNRSQGSESHARFADERAIACSLLELVYDASPLVRAEVACALGRLASGHALLFQAAVTAFRRQQQPLAGAPTAIPSRAASRGIGGTGLGSVGPSEMQRAGPALSAPVPPQITEMNAPIATSAPATSSSTMIVNVDTGNGGGGSTRGGDAGTINNNNAKAAGDSSLLEGKTDADRETNGGDAQHNNKTTKNEPIESISDTRVSSPTPAGAPARQAITPSSSSEVLTSSAGPRAVQLTSGSAASSVGSPGVLAREGDVYEPALMLGLDGDAAVGGGLFASPDAARVGGGLYPGVLGALCTLGQDPAPGVAAAAQDVLLRANVEFVILPQTTGSGPTTGSTAPGKHTSRFPSGAQSATSSPRPPLAHAQSVSVLGLGASRADSDAVMALDRVSSHVLPKAWQPRSWLSSGTGNATPSSASAAPSRARSVSAVGSLSNSPKSSPSPPHMTFAAARPAYYLREVHTSVSGAHAYEEVARGLPRSSAGSATSLAGSEPSAAPHQHQTGSATTADATMGTTTSEWPSPTYAQAAEAFKWPLLAPQALEEPGPPSATWLDEPEPEVVRACAARREAGLNACRSLPVKGPGRASLQDVVHTVNTESDRVAAVMLDALRPLLVTADAEGGIRVSRYANGTILNAWTMAGAGATTTSSSSNVVVNGTSSGTMPTTSQLRAAPTTALYQLNEAGNELLLACGTDGAVRVWRDYAVQGQQRLATAWQAVLLPRRGAPAWPATFAWSGREASLIAAGGKCSDRIYVWDVERESCVRTMRADLTMTNVMTNTVGGVASSDSSPGDSFTGTGQTGSVSSPFAPSPCIDSLALPASGRSAQVLHVADSGGTVRVFDLRASGTAPVATLSHLRSRLAGVVVEPGGVSHRVVLGYPSGVLAFADLRGGTGGANTGSSTTTSSSGTGGVWKVVEAHRKPYLTAVVGHPHAPLIATASTSQVVKVWSPEGDALGVIRAHTSFLSHRPGPITCLAWAPYDLCLASGGHDRVAAVYRVAAGAPGKSTTSSPTVGASPRGPGTPAVTGA